MHRTSKPIAVKNKRTKEEKKLSDKRPAPFALGGNKKKLRTQKTPQEPIEILRHAPIIASTNPPRPDLILKVKARQDESNRKGKGCAAHESMPKLGAKATGKPLGSKLTSRCTELQTKAKQQQM